MFLFHFIQNRRLYFGMSGVIVALAVGMMLFSTAVTGSPFAVGVDFQSGTRFEVQFQTEVSEEAIREVFQANNLNNPTIIRISGVEESIVNGWQIRVEFLRPEVAQGIANQLNEVAPLIPNTTQIEAVSPTVGSEVTQAAFVAIISVAVVILGYMAFAFRQIPNAYRYGACAVSAMFHDLLVIFGFISLFSFVLGWEVDSLFVTAVLTIAGFSLQDTIIVFDRLRENLLTRPLEKFEVIVNRSVLETLHRSMATQLAATLVLAALLLFGGYSIKPFIAILLVGFVSGSYSSIFHAVPLLAEWEIRSQEAQAA